MTREKISYISVRLEWTTVRKTYLYDVELEVLNIFF